MKKPLLYLTIIVIIVCIGMLVACTNNGSDSIDDNHTHEYGNWNILISPTCDSEGIKMRNCIHCNAEEKEAIAPRHSLEDYEGKEPTCTSDGWTPYVKCRYCNYSTYQIINRLGHSFVNNTCVICGFNATVDLAFSINDDGNSYTVTGIGESSDIDIIIPYEYNNLPVTKIGNEAFKNCNEITSVEILYGIITIGDNAFSGCSNLTNIIIPSSVTNIGESIFADCINLGSISVHKNNPTYDSRYDCNAIIHSRTNTLIAGCMNTFIPNSVNSIGENAFSGCNIEALIIPHTIISIGDGAFS